MCKCQITLQVHTCWTYCLFSPPRKSHPSCSWRWDWLTPVPSVICTCMHVKCTLSSATQTSIRMDSFLKILASIHLSPVCVSRRYLPRYPRDCRESPVWLQSWQVQSTRDHLHQQFHQSLSSSLTSSPPKNPITRKQTSPVLLPSAIHIQEDTRSKPEL